MLKQLVLTGIGWNFCHLNDVTFLFSARAASVLLRLPLRLHPGLQTSCRHRVEEGDGDRPGGQTLRAQRLRPASHDGVPGQNQSVQQERRGTLQPHRRHLLRTGRWDGWRGISQSLNMPTLCHFSPSESATSHNQGFQWSLMGVLVYTCSCEEF